MAYDLIREAVAFYWGAPCEEYDETCYLCRAWREVAEIDRLRERLEIPEDPEIAHYDGIACRDETITLLEKEIDRLRAATIAMANTVKELLEKAND